jgi:hypothetical protein
MKRELLDQNPKPKRRNVKASTKIQIYGFDLSFHATWCDANGHRRVYKEHGMLANLRVGSVLPPD